MKTTIKTPFGEMTFEMSQQNAMALMQQAMRYAADEVTKPEPENAVESPLGMVQYTVEPAVENPAPKPRSTRAENMFGSRETWNTPANETQPRLDGYKGFLYIKCEKCGKIKAFCAKIPTTDHRCECGHVTELRDLLPVHVECECGGNYTYKTNLQEKQFTISCLRCESPVDMELNGRETAYVPMGRKNASWGGVQQVSLMCFTRRR